MGCMKHEQPKIYNLERYVLGADLHMPDTKKKVPAVILLHGFCGFKDQTNIVALANLLAENGIAAIRFDASGFGTSEGTVEDDFRVSNYLLDIDYVYHFLFHHEGINPAQIGIWGVSMGGTMAIVYATENKGIKAVSGVSCPGVLGEAAWIKKQLPNWEKTGHLEMDTEVYGTVQVPFSFVKDANRFGNALQKAPKLTQPLQIIVGAEDDVTLPDDSRAIFDAAPDPKEWVEIPGMDHNYEDDFVDQVNQPVLAFFQSHLR